MNVDDLKQRIRRGDRDAARALLEHALQARDVQHLLAAWRLLFPARLNAWQALKAAQRVRAGDPSRGGAQRPQDTQLVQNEITAQVLIESTRRRAGVDPIAGRLLDLADHVLRGGGLSAEGFAEIEGALFSQARLQALINPLLSSA